MLEPSPKTEAFLKAYDELADAIFRHCYFRIYDRERAKDLMQECFARTWEYLASGKEVANLKAFIYRVANNLIIDNVRKKKETSLDALMEEGFAPDAGDTAARAAAPSAERAAEAQLLIDRLDGLDPKYRDVVVMRHLDGLSPKEIAEIVGESENVVSVRIHRGIEQIRKQIR